MMFLLCALQVCVCVCARVCVSLRNLEGNVLLFLSHFTLRNADLTEGNTIVG